MKSIEKIARDICWLGFSPGYRSSIEVTKAQYWKELPENARKNYECEARRFVYLLAEMPVETVNTAHAIAALGK